MALITGQCRTDTPPTTGISARLYAGLVARAAYSGMVALTQGSGPRDAVAAMFEGIADGLRETLLTDARVEVVIPANALGSGIPASDVTISNARIK